MSVVAPIQTRKDSAPRMRAMGRFRPETVSLEERTVDLVITTGADVPRMDWWDGQMYMERLSLAPGAARLHRVDNGAVALLDSHDSRKLASQLGKVERVWFEDAAEGRVGVATVRFSRRPEVEGVFQDVADGIITTSSVGYIPWRTRVTTNKDGPDLHDVEDWELLELSLASVPADGGVRTRSGHEATYPCVVEHTGHEQESPMATTTKTNEGADGVDMVQLERERCAGIFALQRTHGVSDDAAQSAIGDGISVERAEERFRSMAGARSAADAVEAAKLAERTRIAKIREAGTKHDVSAELVESLIAEERSVEDSLTVMLDHVKRAAAKKPSAGAKPDNTVAAHTRVTVGTEALEKRLHAMGCFMKHRALPARYKVEGGAEMFAGYRMVDLCQDYLEQRGINTRGRTPQSLIIEALAPSDPYRPKLPIKERSLGGLHGIADLIDVFGGVTNDVLLDAYKASGAEWRHVTAPVTLTNFEETGMVRMGDMPDLLPVNEHGEYKRGKLETSKETIRVEKQGRIIGLTLEALMSDKWDVLGKIPMAFGAAASRSSRRRFFALVIAGKTILMKTDGLAVYNVASGTLIHGTSTPPDLTGLQKARNAMRLQQTLAGDDMELEVRHLFIPDQYELELAQLLKTTGDPADPAKRTPGYMERMSFTVASQITRTDDPGWYAFADPAECAAIAHGTLQGEEAVSVAQRVGFDVDGIEHKVTLFDAFAWLDRRGVVHVTNAAEPE